MDRRTESLVFGLAHYRLAELHRLRGEFGTAEEHFRHASQWGLEPQSGLALLRLAQGQIAPAVAAIRRVLDEAHDPVTRLKVLPAAVEIMLAGSDVGSARTTPTSSRT